MPHGGPELRDYVTFASWAQMLANQGYAVLQPNFRGSAGYGRAFAEAGYRQWAAACKTT
jgi:dipeptidyl aminopeptidase/acylaminoacyl peptidase